MPQAANASRRFGNPIELSRDRPSGSAGVIQLCDEVLRQPALAIGIPPGAKVPVAYQALVEELSGFLDIRLVLLEDEPLRSLPAMASLLQPAYELPEPVALADAVIVVPALRRDAAGSGLVLFPSLSTHFGRVFCPSMNRWIYLKGLL